jgi:hypothetical protein
MAVEFILGMNAKLYYHATAGTALTAMTAIVTNVKDLTLSLEAGEADITTRANSGWKASAATLREASMEFEMLWLPEDAGFAALKTAFLTSVTLAMCPLTGVKTTGSKSEGLSGDWAITGFSRAESLTEGITVKVTAKLSKFAAWEVCT